MTTTSDNFALSAYLAVLQAFGETTQLRFGTAPGSNVVTGTSGNDLIVGASGQGLIGGGGNDALLGGAGNEVLFASTDPTLQQDPQVAAAGTDAVNNFNYLSGGPNDVLVGGSGIDLFVFASGSGQNSILGFTPQIDGMIIQSNIDGSGINSFQSLQSHMSQGPSGVVIDFGNGDTATIQGVSVSQLVPQNFTFI